MNADQIKNCGKCGDLCKNFTKSNIYKKIPNTQTCTYVGYNFIITAAPNLYEYLYVTYNTDIYMINLIVTCLIFLL